jgi:N-acetylglucosamine-6-phosphate deacetylase
MVPEAIRILVNARGADKVVLITDCMMAGGLCEGDYVLGELAVTVKDSAVRLVDSGVLAGSILDLMTAVRNMHEAVGVSFVDAVRMASLTPAESLGLADIGVIKLGKRAELISIDQNYTVVFVMIDCKVVLDKR